MIAQKKLPVTGFETGSSGIGRNHAVNCATTTACPLNQVIVVNIEKLNYLDIHSLDMLLANFWLHFYLKIQSVEAGKSKHKNKCKQCCTKTKLGTFLFVGIHFFLNNDIE